MTDNQKNTKRMPIEERMVLRYDDVSRRAAAVARLIDRAGAEGLFYVRVEKAPSKWVVSLEQVMTIQELDLTQ